MNFTNFEDDLSQEFGFTKKTSRKIIMFLLKKIRTSIMFGQELSLRGIGKFVLRVRKPKKFLNLQSGEMQISKKSYYLDFKVYDNLKEYLKKKTVY